MPNSPSAPLPLPHTARARKGPPVVLLHGFGLDRDDLTPLGEALSAHRRTIAFDMPGHGAAVPWPDTPDAKACALAVCDSLDAMKVPRAAFVGHSLGGAVAALVGLLRPDLVERLILLAPGGFGTEMNVRLLERYAGAATKAELAPLVDIFFSPQKPVPPDLVDALIERRQKPHIAESHRAILGKMAKAGGQGMFNLETLARSPFAISLIWGEDDMILPFAQAERAGPTFAVHRLPRVGHMPHLEAPDLVQSIIVRTLLGRQ